ncbi:MAG: glycogen/starch synthase [Tenuifilum sp.]|uniref:glycogen/starch synthase n=1 Tax=Tenuifilum sp. TaxID=2760880 RepID=UPI001B5066B1|nr:glycogen/starch synthase [Bacteroidales bacterium]HOK60200.1 glycogen/starch synthase [Tenuifilum sp.]MBP9028924.1 glycogen/starch synthase [Bacteroidales bacterium]HOK85080.1 glycogen/starch synthase [Tenuifilum sp.]HON70125.1 glycogen/starch synthase [Tenuifilum sp.]
MKEKKAKILFISQEILPYLPESEVSKISRFLPQGIQEKGREIRTFMPRYGCVNERRNQLHEVIRLSGMNLIINDMDHPLIIKVASIQSARMQVYFIDNEDYFQRKSTLTDENGETFDDNDERAIFFSKGVIETVKKLRWSPDLIHCHGWFTAFAPLMIKKAYADDPLFAHSKVVFSVYNDGFSKPLNENARKKVLMEGISKKDVEILREPTYENLLKLAVNFSDGVILGSPTVNGQVLEHINTAKKPLLPYQDSENYIDIYDEFYNQILNGNSNVSKKK